MSTLFSNSNADNGYRLRYLEVFNWGTFNGKVYKLQPDGRTSLLTGANGSGKTTLIDALLTILVPTNQRFYNQSSGAESKRERDENSYFWGHYGKTFSDVDEKSKTEQLRSKADNPYSVLLACFQNAGTQHTITLAQVRWFANGGLQKVFIVSPHQLSVAEHFGEGHFDFKGEWRKKLVKQRPRTEILNSFKEYAARFSEYFGLKDKALSLFSKTVGIKVLGDLTNFIRQDMLEEADAEEQFKALYDQYSNLLISHKAIQKDEKQLELLDPIIKGREALKELKKQKETLDFIEGQMQYYLNKMEYSLLEKDVERLERDIEFATGEKKQVVEILSRLIKEKEGLITQRAALNIDAQIMLLSQQIDTETEKRDQKKQVSILYVDLCTQAGLDTDIDARVFKSNYDKLVEEDRTLSGTIEQLSEEKISLRIKQDSANTTIEGYQQQITSLQARRNRIPDDLINARKRLAEILETTEEELPFVGELIKIKPEEQQWEDSIEKLLHSFAMQLLVPEKLSKAANSFIYNNDMQTKLVYQKIDRKLSGTIVRWPPEDEALINKLEIPESINKTWLETMLLERYNYFCTDNLDIFYNCSKAITSNGLIRNINRHEKDDRPGVWNKSKYRLGPDTRTIVQFLQGQKNAAIKEYEKIGELLKDLSPRIEVMRTKAAAITGLMRYKSFDEINWGQHAEKINGLNKQVQDLKKSSDKYQTIIKQIEVIEKDIEKEDSQKDILTTRIAKLDEEYNKKNLRKLALSFDELSDEGEEAIIAFLSEEEIAVAEIKSLTQFENLHQQAGIKHKKRHSQATNAVHQAENDIIKHIAAFVHPGEKITSEFSNWSGDTMNMRADATALDDLEELHRTILTQRLVEHKRRFRDYMDKSMLDALTSYRTWLKNEYTRITDMIEELNVPLKKITFNRNPDTYLQLEWRPLRGENEINNFREQLNTAIPNTLDFALQKDDNQRVEVFHRIRDLITELQNEETRRRKVTDVRNWLTFSAREYTQGEHKAGQYHDNTASYSGGQKAQFTYAILGAAIAHQFGIFQQGKQHKSLRFITVDEAFSKLDPEKSQFLMEFCEQLNLQLLVVTPLDKINIAEPYIHAVHYVEIKNKKSSVLYNLTMEQYQEKKEAFKQLSETPQ